MAGDETPETIDAWMATAAAFLAVQEWPPGFVTPRPVRILFGVWRN
jgi:hypothetical protein